MSGRVREYECTVPTGIAPANHIHANEYIHTFARADWPIVTETAAGQPARVHILRIGLKGPIGNSNFLEVRVQRNGLAQVFQYGLKEDGYISSNPHVKHGLFPFLSQNC